MNVGFGFLFNGTKHRIGLLGTVPDTWPPTSPETVTEFPDGDSFFNWNWSVSVDKKNKNNPGVCTGEGFDIKWAIRVAPCGPPLDLEACAT